MAELGLSPDLYKELRRSGEFSINKVFSHLVKEPYNLSFDQLEKLTPVIVRHVYFRDPDNDEDRLSVPPAIAHRQECMAKGMTEEEIQSSWQARLDADETLRKMHIL